jgi:hypothetical protein
MNYDSFEVKQVELKAIKLTTPDVDFIKLWLQSKENIDVNNYVEKLMRQIVRDFERAELIEVL